MRDFGRRSTLYESGRAEHRGCPFFKYVTNRILGYFVDFFQATLYISFKLESGFGTRQFLAPFLRHKSIFLAIMDTLKRKLTAILSADVAGYSFLMSEDEASTVRTLQDYREIISGFVEEYRGRVVDSPGDNLMAEFASVVDAAQCAVEIQSTLAEKNDNLPENRRMHFRIGINLGDVIEDDGRIYGDGVNIAARIESLADPGGICLSGSAYEQVESKLSWGFEYLGKRTVKNMAKPIRVYRITQEPGDGERARPKKIKVKKWSALAVAIGLIVIAGIGVRWFYGQNRSVQNRGLPSKHMAMEIPDKPSIAVLPFDNLSDEPNQEYIADGLTENIIASLSHISEMFVISRNSTFVYKGMPVNIQQVSKELGVRYVLEGSVQKSGDKLRITAQLIDAESGYHMWAKRYDRNLEDLFDLQDDITLKIIQALAIKLTIGEEMALRQTTENLEAWGQFVKGTGLFENFTKKENQLARDHFKEAVKIDPEYAFAWTMLAWTHVIDAWFTFSESNADSIRQAVISAKQAAKLNGDQPELHSLWSTIALIQGQHEKAVTEGRKAVDIGPSNALSHLLLAYVLIFNGEFTEAATFAERAIRLTPYCPGWYLGIMAHAYRQSGRYEDAYAMYSMCLDRSLKNNASPLNALIGMIDVSIQLGRKKEAAGYVTELLKALPEFSLEGMRPIFPYKNPEHLERILTNLETAGLK